MSSIIAVRSSGTKYGLSSIEDTFDCERKARHLWEDKQINFDEMKRWMQPEPKGTKNRPGVASMLCGSLFGATYEKFYQGEEIPDDFRYTYEDQDVEAVRGATCNESRRCFNHFRYGLGSRSDFGDVLSTEEQYEDLDFFGGPVSGAADVVAHLNNAECSRLEEKFGIKLFGEGVYLVDCKLYGRQEEDRHAVWETRIQGKAYLLLHALKYNIEPKGFLYDVIYKYVTPERELFVTPPASEDDLKMVRHLVTTRAEMMAKSIEQARANPTSDCHKCFLYRNGLCRRY